MNQPFFEQLPLSVDSPSLGRWSHTFPSMPLRNGMGGFFRKQGRPRVVTPASASAEQASQRVVAGGRPRRWPAGIRRGEGAVSAGDSAWPPLSWRTWREGQRGATAWLFRRSTELAPSRPHGRSPWPKPTFWD